MACSLLLPSLVLDTFILFGLIGFVGHVPSSGEGSHSLGQVFTTWVLAYPIQI